MIRLLREGADEENPRSGESSTAALYCFSLLKTNDKSFFALTFEVNRVV